MASLLVELHAVVDRYIKKSSNKELSGDIGSNVLEAARNVVKTVETLRVFQHSAESRGLSPPLPFPPAKEGWQGGLG
jgi:hypothetical protein